MAGSISLSLSQQFDSLGNPLNGGKLFTYAAGTTTPQSAYQDTGLTVALSNPVLCDSAGRLPQMFFADGNIKVRLTDVNGTTQLAADNILVIGASAGGGGGATVDPTTVLQTGWLQPIYGTGNVTGFVRANGRTLGNASSGATERANADTSALFTFLYNADTNLAVSGGRGASAAADYAANKTIALPDFRGRALAGLDDMGNSAAGRLTSTYFGTSAIVLGAAGGAESKALAANHIPAGVPSSASNNITVNYGGKLSISSNNQATVPVSSSGSLYSIYTPSGVADWILNNTASAATANSISVASTNASQANVAIAQPTMLITLYLKL